MKIRIANIKINMAIIWMLAMLFLPTSISNTQIMTSWTTLYYMITLVVFFILAIPVHRKSLKTMGWLIFAVGVLLVCTWLTVSLKSGFVAEYGNVRLYLCLVLILSLQLENYEMPEIYDKVFVMVCIIFIVAGFLVIGGNQQFKDFLNSYFTQHREYGTYVATQRGKPVGTFVQHSISAVMYYLMATLLYFRNQKKKSIINYILIAGFVVLIINLKSFTALAVLGLAVVLLLLNNKGSDSFNTYVFKMTLVILMIVVVLFNTDYITQITDSDVNGLAGRFTGTSAFLQNFEFLKNNILPVGLANSSSLWMTDCGYIVNLLRGGIVFVVIFYGAFITFTWKNSKMKKAAIAILAAVLLFEIGYPILFEFRFIGFLPFYILYSNYLSNYIPDQKQEVKSGK